MRVRTDAATAPYLRATTLSRFDGSVWEPDRVRTVPLESELAARRGVAVDEDIRLTRVHDHGRGDQPRVGVAAGAVPGRRRQRARGRWAACPYNRTVARSGGATQGQTYEVVADVPRPTLEQIARARRRTPRQRDETTTLPAGIPPIIGELAAEVTAEATNDYDRLIALQRWFRGGEFELLARGACRGGVRRQRRRRHREVPRGARGLLRALRLGLRPDGPHARMPSRVVVGYLPGARPATSSRPSRLLGLEPAAARVARGVLRGHRLDRVRAHRRPRRADHVLAGREPLPGAPDDPTAATARRDASLRLGRPPPTSTRDQVRAAGGPGAEAATVNPLPALRRWLGILLAPRDPRASPASCATGSCRRRAQRRCRSGLDDGAGCRDRPRIPVPASESPRAFASRLVERARRAAEAMRALVSAHRARELRPVGKPRLRIGRAMTDAAIAVRAALLRRSTPVARVLALLAPRSLIVRPGSVYAGRSRGRAARIR